MYLLFCKHTRTYLIISKKIRSYDLVYAYRIAKLPLLYQGQTLVSSLTREVIANPFMYTVRPYARSLKCLAEPRSPSTLVCYYCAVVYASQALFFLTSFLYFLNSIFSSICPLPKIVKPYKRKTPGFYARGRKSNKINNLHPGYSTAPVSLAGLKVRRHSPILMVE